jgi:hypothetical protein
LRGTIFLPGALPGSAHALHLGTARRRWCSGLPRHNFGAARLLAALGLRYLNYVFWQLGPQVFTDGQLSAATSLDATLARGSNPFGLFLIVSPAMK